MGRPKNAEASARPALATARLKPEQMVTLTAQRSQVVKGAPGYATALDVQKAIGVWDSAADTVDKGAQLIAATRLTLVALLATQFKDIASWHRATQSVLAAIGAASGGSAQAILQWGFAPATHVLLPLTSDAPANLRAAYTKQLVLLLKWAGVRGHLGYFVQLGDGTPTGWGAPIPCPKARYEPTGLAPGQKLAVRVAVQRKTGLSVWSDPVTITAR
jgi:hypothetical protein